MRCVGSSVSGHLNAGNPRLGPRYGVAYPPIAEGLADAIDKT